MEEVAGWITFKTKIDDKYFKDGIKENEKEIKRLEKEGKDLEKQKTAIKVKYETDKEAYEKSVREAQNYIERSKRDGSFSRYTLQQAKYSITGQESFEKSKQDLEDINKKIEDNNKKLEDTKINIKGIEKQYDEWKNKQKEVNDEEEKSEKNHIKIGNGLSGVIRKVARWGLAIFGIRGAYNLIRQAMSTISQENAKIGADLEYMRWAISKALEPVVIKIVGWMMKLMQIINYVVYRLTGFKLFGEATANSFKKANGSAKQLQKTLAGFDEMNIVGSSSSGGGGGVTLPSEDLNDFGQLSDKLKGKLDILVEALRPFWEILKKVGEWIKEHPEGLGAILGGLLTAGIIKKIIGVGGSGAIAGSGLLGIIGLLMFITAEAWVIKLEWDEKEYDDLQKRTKSLNDSIEKGTENWKKNKKSLIEDAKAGNLNEKQTKNLATALLNNVSANDELIKSSGVRFETQKKLRKEQEQDLEVLREMYLQDQLDGEQKKILKKRYEEQIEVLKKQRDSVRENSWEYTNYSNELYTLEGQLNSLTIHDWVVEVGDKTDTKEIDKTEQKVKDLTKKDWTISINGNTSKFNKTMSNLLNKIGSSLFNSLFPGLGGFKTILNKFKYAKGGIINLPGRGVPIGGEAGKEGVIPLTDEQQMQLLGESIGKYVTINLTNITKLDSREISKQNEKVRNENDFIRNR